MKKKLCLMLFAALLVSPSFCQNAGTDLQLPGYPAYKEVIQLFLSQYSINGIEYPKQFALAKKPDGWHVMILDLNSGEPERDEIFWDRAKAEFLQVDFPKEEMEMEVEAVMEMEPEIDTHDELINDWQANYFTGISPFWGYTGWDKDVIDAYADKTNLSDTLLNALARAYCSYAINLLINNTGFASKETRFSLPVGQNALTAEQLKTYRLYEYKGIETYYKLWKKNPAFETFVADVYNVYSNEVMNCYLTILYFQNKEEAKKELRAGLYDPVFIDMAKKYLASCDANAILIVNGDSDTYPLLYVQEYMGFRKDVKVVNISLMGSGRYISHLFEPDQNPVPLSVDRKTYAGESKQVVYLTEREPTLSLSDAIQLVASADKELKLEFNGEYYDHIPTKRLFLTVSPRNIPDYTRLYGESLPDTIWIEPEKNYLFLNNFCFFDLLSTNYFRRPLYFATTVSDENFFNLKQYFQCEGIAYKIMPYTQQEPAKAYYVGSVNSEVQYNKLMHDLAFGDLPENLHFQEAHARIISNYRMVYGRLLEKLVEENQTDKGREVLQYCVNNFSAARAEPDYFSLLLVEGGYKLKETKLADQLAGELLLTTSKMKGSADPNDYELRLKYEILKILDELTGEYSEQSELHRQISMEYDAMKDIFN
jgi:hypothetical protein